MKAPFESRAGILGCRNSGIGNVSVDPVRSRIAPIHGTSFAPTDRATWRSRKSHRGVSTRTPTQHVASTGTDPAREESHDALECLCDSPNPFFRFAPLDRRRDVSSRHRRVEPGSRGGPLRRGDPELERRRPDRRRSGRAGDPGRVPGRRRRDVLQGRRPRLGGRRRDRLHPRQQEAALLRGRPEGARTDHRADPQRGSGGLRDRDRRAADREAVRRRRTGDARPGDPPRAISAVVRRESANYRAGERRRGGREDGDLAPDRAGRLVFARDRPAEPRLLASRALPHRVSGARSPPRGRVFEARGPPGSHRVVRSALDPRPFELPGYLFERRPYGVACVVRRRRRPQSRSRQLASVDVAGRALDRRTRDRALPFRAARRIQVLDLNAAN